MRPTHASAYPAAGEILDGKYQLLQMLGEGGMGAVAKAHHILRRAPVALKFMAPHVLNVPGAVERFLNEAVAASQIENHHVVTIYDVGKLPNGAPYLVMEFLDGRDLAHLIETEGRRGIDVPRAVHFVLQILRALQVAHLAGIIHRDLKPSNAFIIKKDGERDFVKLVDFGISKVSQPGAASLTQTNSALGTPLYMSPEQAKSPRDVDLRSDIYSVACILYELLTGQTPHTADSGELTEILFKLFTQDPTPIQNIRGDLPPGLAEVVHKGLARDRDARYANAAEFAAGLAPYADARSAQVIARLEAPDEKRSEPPPMQGSMPAPMASMQAFSQLNSVQFPQVPVPAFSVAPPNAATGTAAFGPSSLGTDRTQALPSSLTPSAPAPVPRAANGSPIAAAGTQSSRTALQDADGREQKRTSPQSGKAPLWVFAPIPIVVLAGIGYFAFGRPAPAPSNATREPAPAAAPQTPTTAVTTAPVASASALVREEASNANANANASASAASTARTPPVASSASAKTKAAGSSETSSPLQGIKTKTTWQQ